MTIKNVSIKGMHKVNTKTYTLQEFTYLYGKNGAGKSTVMNAIQLALLGYIPGTNKSKEAIMTHANGDMLEVTLVMMDKSGQNISISRRWERKGKEIEATVETNPEGIETDSIIGDLKLPILDFNEFMSMTANKLKDWFIDFLPDVDATSNWYDILRDSVADDILLEGDKEFIFETANIADGMKSNGIQKVRKFNEYLKEQQSAKKAETDRLQKTVQSLVYYDDCDTETDIDTVKFKINAISKLREHAVIQRSTS